MSLRGIICCAAGCLVGTMGAVGQAQAPDKRADLEASVARLEQEVRELRQMLIQAMRIEQQHHDLVLRLFQSGAAGERPAATPVPGAAVAEPAPDLDAGGPAGRPRRTGTVSGTVKVTGAPADLPAFVFVEDLEGPGTRGQTIEIVQKGKQFSPQAAVVPVGTRALFPNRDPVFHNAFSLTRGNAFDLGLKAGERGSPVRLGRPGLVAVYCDIHARMWAEVLVVRSGYIARVGPDGSFTLPDVPVGERVISAWTAGAKPVKRAVQLTASGARVDLAVPVPPRPAHNNKLGQPYGNYSE